MGGEPKKQELQLVMLAYASLPRVRTVADRRCNAIYAFGEKFKSWKENEDSQQYP